MRRCPPNKSLVQGSAQRSARASERKRVMYCEWTLRARSSALLRSGDLLTHHRENGLSAPAVARYHAFELRAPVRRHAEAADDDVADLVDAVAHREAPINSDRLNCWAEGFGIAGDFAQDDHPIRCEPAADGSGPIAIAGILGESIGIGEHDVILE